jgi:hypothetical protein
VKGVNERFSSASPKVIWIGIQYPKKNIRKFIMKHDVYEGVGFDQGNLVANKYGIRYGAGLVMIDAEGVVKVRVPKGFSEIDLHEAMKKLIMNEHDEKSSRYVRGLNA